MIEYDSSRLQRISEVDPHINNSSFNRFVKKNYGDGIKAIGSEVSGEESPDTEFTASSKAYDIRGVTSRPGMGSATLGRERMRNRPSEDGDYEVYRGDPIAISTYKKMSSDPEIAFGTFLLKGWVGGLPYTIDCSDKMVKGIVEHVLDDLWKDLIRNMMDSLKTGFAFGEKVWERQDAMIVSDDDDGNEEVIYDGKIAAIDKIKFLDPTHNFEFWKKNDEITRVKQQQVRRKIEVKRDKLVWFAMDQEYSSIFGRARYKNVYSEWYYSNVNVKYLLNDLQKRGSPHIEVRFPPGSTRMDDGRTVDNADLAIAMAQKMMSDGIVAIPHQADQSGNQKWSIEYADTKQDSSKSPHLEFLKYSSEQKMKGLGIPPQVADSDSNFSSADAGGDMLVVVVEDIVNQLEDRIQKDVVDYIVEYNFGPKMRSLVNLKIDKSALGRRNLVKEIFKTMLRTGTSMQGRTLKSWPDVKSMGTELGVSMSTFEDAFIEVEGTDRPEGESAVDERERDEDSNDQDIRRDGKDNRDRERDSANDSATETD